MADSGVISCGEYRFTCICIETGNQTGHSLSFSNYNIHLFEQTLSKIDNVMDNVTK